MIIKLFVLAAALTAALPVYAQGCSATTEAKLLAISDDPAIVSRLSDSDLDEVFLDSNDCVRMLIEAEPDDIKKLSAPELRKVLNGAQKATLYALIGQKILLEQMRRQSPERPKA